MEESLKKRNPITLAIIPILGYVLAVLIGFFSPMVPLDNIVYLVVIIMVGVVAFAMIAYPVQWLYETSEELSKLDTKAPNKNHWFFAIITMLFLFGIVWYIILLNKYAKSADKVTKGAAPKMMTFLLMLFAPLIGMMVVQSKFNKFAGGGIDFGDDENNQMPASDQNGKGENTDGGASADGQPTQNVQPTTQVQGDAGLQSDHSNPAQPDPSQTNPAQPNSSQPNTSQPNPSQPNPAQPNTSQPNPAAAQRATDSYSLLVQSHGQQAQPAQPTGQALSHNEQQAKQYIEQYKAKYPRDALKAGLVQGGIPEQEAITYIDKYLPQA